MEQIEQTPTPNAPAPRKNKKKLIKWILIGLAGILVLTALALIISNAVELNSSYNRAIEFLSQEQFDQAESAAKEIRSRELREKYYTQRNKAASQKALELLEDGNIEQAFRLADIISDPLILREFNNKFYPAVYEQAIAIFDSGEQARAREFMEKYASKSYEYMRKFNQYAGSQ